MNHARYHVLHATAAAVVTKDVGPWTRNPTVTNDAEHVVSELRARGEFADDNPHGARTRLFYFDSEGNFDEIVMGPSGHFLAFAAIRPSRFTEEE